MENEEYELESFQFCEEVEGVEHSYRITNDEGRFMIEKDGKLIAMIQHNEEWEQSAGEELPNALLQKIFDRIEDHYE